MSWETVKGNWNELSGKIKEKWGQLTDDDMAVVDGRRDQLVGILQHRYGYERDEAERAIDDFVAGV